MWFKNLHLYRVHDAPELAFDALVYALAEQAFRPLGDTEARRIGWAAPVGSNGTHRLHEVNGQRLVTALRQERMLPPSVVAEEVEARAADLEADQGQPLRRPEKQALKEQVYEEFLPRAFVRTQRIDLWWDTQRQLLGVNAASRKLAEEALDLLRQTLGSLKVTPLATQATPARAMTDWLRDPAQRPAWLEVGDQAVLKATTGDESVFTARQADLDGDEVLTLLDAGRQATRMAFTINESLSLVLTDDLTFKGLRFADALLDEASQTDDDDSPTLRLETDFALMTGALTEALTLLVDGLGGEAMAAAPAP